MLMVSFLFAGSSAWAVQPGDFFDFEFAKTVWLQWPDEQFSRELGKCPNGGVFEQWRHRRDAMGHAAALAELETHPQADLIRRCWDVVLTYENVWLPMYRKWSLSIFQDDGPNAWGECPSDHLADGYYADSMRSANVFTHRCDDMPDWRLPEDVTSQERRLEGKARRLRDKREADRAKRNAG